MKKLLFVLAFAFIGQQAFSQLYSVIIDVSKYDHPSGCPSPQDPLNSSYLDGVMTTITPAGSITYTCLPGSATDYSIVEASYLLIHQELNNIISMGYKIVGTPIDDFSVYYNITQVTTLILLSTP